MSTTPSPIRHRNVTDLPMPGLWELDPGHAEVAFVGRHLMLAKVRGRFRDVRASVEIAQEPSDSMVEARVTMASVDSGDATRDEHLRSSDLFDVDNWPDARFVSTAVEWEGRRGQVIGELSIRDVTRSVALDVEYLGAITDPWGNDRAAFDARTTIDREDWGLTWNMLLDSGGVMVSKQIELEVHVELVRDVDRGAIAERTAPSSEEPAKP